MRLRIRHPRHRPSGPLERVGGPTAQRRPSSAVARLDDWRAATALLGRRRPASGPGEMLSSCLPGEPGMTMCATDSGAGRPLGHIVKPRTFERRPIPLALEAALVPVAGALPLPLPPRPRAPWRTGGRRKLPGSSPAICIAWASHLRAVGGHHRRGRAAARIGAGVRLRHQC